MYRNPKGTFPAVRCVQFSKFSRLPLSYCAASNLSHRVGGVPSVLVVCVGGFCSISLSYSMYEACVLGFKNLCFFDQCSF